MISTSHEVMGLDEFVNLSEHRILLYNFFSRIYARKPDREFLESLLTHELIEIIGGICEDRDTSEKLRNDVEDILSKENNFLKVCEDFENLFMISGGNRFVPPFLSFYSDMPLIDRLKDIYGVFNFGLKDKKLIAVNRPDNISYISGFMAVLINFEKKYKSEFLKGQISLSEILRNEYSFFNEFIQNWINLFTFRIIEKACTPFYIETAQLMQSFTISEARDFKSMLLL